MEEEEDLRVAGIMAEDPRVEEMVVDEDIGEEVSPGKEMEQPKCNAGTVCAMDTMPPIVRTISNTSKKNMIMNW